MKNILPFTEIRIEEFFIRRFDNHVNEEELVWHRDREDREITIIESKDWYLQLEDELPIELNEGEIHFIPKQVWHRVIKRGSSDLVIKIKKFNSTEN